MPPPTGHDEANPDETTRDVEDRAPPCDPDQIAADVTRWQDPIGKPVGDFKIVRELGRGGMGVVYLAEQMSLKRKVALKVLPHQSTVSQKFLQRFEREAEATARLMHDGIVHILQYGVEAGMHYIAMEYIEGVSLERVLHAAQDGGETGGEEECPARLAKLSGTENPADVSGFVALVADALHHAHQRGVLHRDIKPQNILVDKDCRPHIVDFGLAKLVDEASISRSGDISGTPYYMSPEQALAKRVRIDHRTDIFSLGVVLYEMLSRRRPFEGDSFQQVLYGISFRDPPSLRRLNPRTPQPLAVLCAKALEKNPEHRFRDAREMALELRRFADGEPITTRPPSRVESLRRSVSRHRGAVLAAALVLVALVGGMFIGTGGSSDRTGFGNAQLESTTLSFATLFDALNLGLFNGLDQNADLDRRDWMSGCIHEAAFTIGEGDFARAVGLLTGVLEKMDGQGDDDWMHATSQRDAYAVLIAQLIAQLRV